MDDSVFWTELDGLFTQLQAVKQETLRPPHLWAEPASVASCSRNKKMNPQGRSTSLEVEGAILVQTHFSVLPI